MVALVVLPGLLDLGQNLVALPGLPECPPLATLGPAAVDAGLLEGAARRGRVHHAGGVLVLVVVGQQRGAPLLDGVRDRRLRLLEGLRAEEGVAG